MGIIHIKPEHREAIARAILEDEASQNGEHLYDGQRLVFYCPMQAPTAPCHGASARVPVRSFLPAGVRPPTVGEYLARARPGVSLAGMRADERRRLFEAYEADATAELAELLPDAVEAQAG